jgi:glycosyltransferase involved in cell wall biosynthesis
MSDNLLVNIYIMCFNEELLLPFTVGHYRRLFGERNTNITICDNESTDSSVAIAKELGCNVHSFSSNGRMDNDAMMHVRNNIWKSALDGWIIIVDMDELLYITREQLYLEETKKTTILDIQGIQVLGASNQLDLSDIYLAELCNGYEDNLFNKRICFRRTCIVNMNYEPGCHLDYPCGYINYSKSKYYLYHFHYLGIEFTYNRYLERAKRSAHQHNRGLSTHYIISDKEEIRSKYRSLMSKSKYISTLGDLYKIKDNMKPIADPNKKII